VAELRVGVIGAGAVSGPHVAGVQRDGRARVTVVCDVDSRAAGRLAATVGARATEDWRDVVAADDVDAVLVLLPHLLHYPVAAAALEAGKHVSIEKPMAVSSDECRALLASAERSGVVLTVAENTRFVDAYVAAYEVVASGRLGATRLVRAFVYGSAIEEFKEPSGRWKIERGGVGAVIDAAPHFLYLLRWYFGEVAAVQAVLRHWVRDHVLPASVVEDGASVTGLLGNGGYFSTEYALGIEVPWGERLEIYGADGSLVVDQLADRPAVLYRGGADFDGAPLEAVPRDVEGWKTISIERAAADFIGAVLDERPPAVDPRDAAYAIELVEAAYRSAEQGGTAVVLDTAT
jgi:UDP-N-acetylglucosamine 3-dehydrogenase